MAHALLSPPIGFAHRGASARARENTLEAFRLAIDLGATGLESDVWITADGVPVLDHDGEACVAGQVRAIAALLRAELPGHVASLAEFYEACGAEFPLSLDVKDDAAAAATIAVARQARALERLFLCHWNWKTLVRWRNISSEVRLVDSTRTKHMRTPPAPRAERMERLGIDAINLHRSDWREEMVEIFHRRGRLAFAWDTQEESELRETMALGVDAVYSDHVDRMVAVLSTRSCPGGAVR